jgi:hypothetical protein
MPITEQGDDEYYASDDALDDLAAGYLYIEEAREAVSAAKAQLEKHTDGFRAAQRDIIQSTGETKDALHTRMVAFIEAREVQREAAAKAGRSNVGKKAAATRAARKARTLANA